MRPSASLSSAAFSPLPKQRADSHGHSLSALAQYSSEIWPFDRITIANPVAIAIPAKPREALAIGKQLFYQQREMGVAAAYQLASQTMACNMVHPVAQEGVQAFIDKREPQWPA